MAVSGKIDMVDVIIVLIVAVLIIFAARGSVRHFKGEGPCCGGGSSAKAGEKTLSGPVMKRRTLKTLTKFTSTFTTTATANRPYISVIF